MAVGEVYVLDQRALAPYVRPGDELHLAHDFVFLNPAVVGRGVPRDGRRVRGARRARRVAGEVPRQPRPSAHRQPYGPGSAAWRRCTAHAARHAVSLPGRRAGLTDVEVPPDREVDVDGRDSTILARTTSRCGRVYCAARRRSSRPSASLSSMRYLAAITTESSHRYGNSSRPLTP